MSGTGKLNTMIFLNRVFILAMFLFSLLATPFQLFLYISFLFYIIHLIITKKSDMASPDLSDIFLVFFLISAAISALFAVHKTDAFTGTAAILLYFTIYYYFKNIPLDPAFYKKINMTVAVSLIIWCGFALIHYYIIKETIYINIFGKSILKIMSIHPWLSDKPIISIFEHPAVGGNLIAVALSFLFSYLILNFKSMKLYEKTVFCFSISVSVYTIVLTLTRSAFIFACVSVLISVLLTRKYKLMLVLIIFSALFFLFPSEKIRNTIKNPFNSLNVPGRILQYRAGLEIFLKNNPVWGIGLLNFQHEFEKTYSSRSEFVKVPYIHNNYLSILVETGFLGFISFFGFIFYLIFSTAKNNFRSWNAPSLNGVIMLAGFLADSFFDAVLYTIPIALFIWIAAGLSQNKTIAGEPRGLIPVKEENKTNE